MITASPYTIEGILKKMDKNAIDAKKEVYKLAKKYTEDSELLEIKKLFRGFEKKTASEKKKIKKEIRDKLNQMVHLRSVGIAGGHDLPFSDLRRKKMERKLR